MSNEPNYVTWSNTAGLNKALQQTAGAVDEYAAISNSQASSYNDRTFVLDGTNTSVRSEYNRGDYDYYRRNEQVPTGDKAAIDMCMNVYERIGIVYNVINMMSDFTVQGIRITHPNPKIENFHKNWAKSIGFQETSERISNMLYRAANCPVRKKYGKISIHIEKEWRKNFAKEGIKVKKPKVDKRVIPMSYNILNPMTIEVVGGDLAVFTGKPIYGLKLTNNLKNMIKRMSQISLQKGHEHIKDMIQVLPEELKKSVVEGKSMYVFPLDEFSMLHYKKDDWKPWSKPMVYSVLDNLLYLEKMHLADISALDGAISQIRLWRLGDLDNKIIPTPTAISKLRNILSNVGTGVLDLVWGPELSFTESNTNVHQFLGADKYQQIMTEIYAGLGVPSSLTGSSAGAGQGFTNNSISMKTLVERLEYGRDILTCFWEKELKEIQLAMGWRFPAKISFDYKVLSDESSERKLLLDMWDRNIISTETIQELAKRDPELETIRINRERRKIKSDNLPQKAGPYHNPQTEHDLRKIILQNGGATPSEVGLELEENKEGEVPNIEKQAELQKEAQIQIDKFKPKSPGGDGRPKNATDKTKRKEKKVKPRTMGKDFLNLFMWAGEAQKSLSEMLSQGVLQKYEKKTLRQLTKSQAEQFEFLKFRILSNLDPYTEVKTQTVYNILGDTNLSISDDIMSIYSMLLKQFKTVNKRNPSLEELRQIQSSAYSVDKETDIPFE